MPAHASPPEPAAHPTHALLLVSDDEALSRALDRVARPRGYRVAPALGARCLELVHALQPDAVVLDLAVPDADLWVLLDRLKHDPRSRHVPVHLVGAGAQGHHALASGALGFLARPVDDDALARALDDAASLVERNVRLLLVVEDDGGRREDIVAAVGGEGVEVTAVAGREALQAIARGRYDAMIVGLDQAGGGGLDLLEALSQRPELRRVPAVAYALDALPAEDEARLSRLERSQVLRPARTPERLLDESALLLHRAQASLPPAQREALLRSLESAPTLAGREVLLVDDDLHDVFALTGLLERYGVKVTCAKGGREALDRLDERGDVDLVLMDVTRPEQGGFEATRAIRARGDLARVPVVALTATGAERERCLAAGAVDCLVKPVEPDLLVSMLRVLVGS